MRVLHVGKFFPPFAGGIEAFTEDLCRAQLELGHEVHALVHAHEATGDDPSHASELNLHRVPVWFELVFTPIAPTFLWHLWRRIRQIKPDVIHFHVPNPSAFWALFLPAARSIPWIIHWHSDVVTSRQQRGLRLAYPFYRLFERALAKRAARIVVTSPGYLADSRPLRPWQAKCEVVPLGLNAARLDPARPAKAWPESTIRLLAIGRLTYYKGFETLLEAIAPIPDVTLVIVGEGRERRRLEACIERLDLTDRVRLVGTVDDASRNRLLADCDVFCLPSLERTEAFGIVLLEAMAFGRPLAVSDIPGSGAPWLASSTGAGILATPRDAADWTRAIRRLVDSPELRRDLGDAGRRAFRERFEIHPVAQRINTLYEEAVSRRR